MIEQYTAIQSQFINFLVTNRLSPNNSSITDNFSSAELEPTSDMEGSNFISSTAALEQWLLLAAAHLSSQARTLLHSAMPTTSQWPPAKASQANTVEQCCPPKPNGTSGANPIPQDVKYREEIDNAAQQHHLDPLLLAAVAAQETGGPGCNSGANIPGVDGTGHGVFQIDSGTWSQWLNTHNNGMDVAENADKAATILSDDLKSTNGNVPQALHLYNAGSLSCPSTRTEWSGGISLNYEDSVLRHLHLLQLDQ